ncbi:MAG: hypothetical protein DLM64_08375 [Solirubrobacterales bacterium]|nr:MAG: hypothetical protein DLM64_08375 [Solirubrobacterales bacterium]
MWRRALGWGAALTLAALIAGPSAGAGAAPHARGLPASRLVVGGAVGAPHSYSLAQLRRLPQTTLNTYQPPGTRPGTHLEQGVSLEDLVDISQPKLPGAKNALLRVTVAVTGRSGLGSSFALGELDPSFGNHPALLVLRQDGASLKDAPELLVPGDHTAGRFVRHVTRVTVAVDSPGPSAPPSPGAVTVHEGSRTTVPYRSRLAELPSQTLTVSFGGPTGAQQHTESGPALNTVLAAGGISPRAVTWVAAVGSDGYVATVTPEESLIGGRPLLLSTHEDGAALSQPRLVADGDVKGGRYVSDVVDLMVGRIPPPRRLIPTCARDAGATVNVAHAGSLTNLVRSASRPRSCPRAGRS